MRLHDFLFSNSSDDDDDNVDAIQPLLNLIWYVLDQWSSGALNWYCVALGSLV